MKPKRDFISATVVAILKGEVWRGVLHSAPHLIGYFEDFLTLQGMGGNMEAARLFEMPTDNAQWRETIRAITVCYQLSLLATEHGRYENMMKGFEILIKKPTL